MTRSWPEPARALYGRVPERILGSHVAGLFADREDGTEVDGPPAGFLEDTGDETVECEGWHERADRSIFWGTLTLSPLSGDRPGFAAVNNVDPAGGRTYSRRCNHQ
jgi:hypothetical protein